MKLNLEIVDQENAEKSDVVICGTTSHFEDDIETQCVDCKIKIFHRPHAPKQPVKICLSCGLKYLDNELRNQFLITKDTEKELKTKIWN